MRVVQGTGVNSEAALLNQEEQLLLAGRLHRVLRPFVLRRVHADVAVLLPPKVIHVVSASPSREHNSAVCIML